MDTESLVASGLNYDLGDHEAVYRALFDAINADGGIHGRQIEPVFAPIDPTKPAPAEAKCLELTEDEDVFVGHRLLPRRRRQLPGGDARHRRRRWRDDP